MDQIAASTPLDPQTNTQVTLPRPYTADVSVTDAKGQPAMGSIPITLVNSSGDVVGSGTAINGTAHISTPNYFENVTAKAEGNDFYMSSQAYGAAVKLLPQMTLSLPKPYYAQVTVKDTQGNLALGPIPVTFETISGETVYNYLLTNGSALVHLPGYYGQLNAFIPGSGYFYPFGATANAQQISTNLQVSLPRPYEAGILITDSNNNLIPGPMNVTVTSTSGTIVGNGTIYNGEGSISVNGIYDQVDASATPSEYYYGSQASGSAIQAQTSTNVSLVLDPTTPNGTNPYVADITVQDIDGNLALGSLSVTLQALNGTNLVSGTVENGTVRLNLPDYEESAIAVVGGSSYYIGSQGTGTVLYNLSDMIHNQGNESDPVAGAKFYIIKQYIENSSAFDYNSTTGNYSMNNEDAFNGWTDTVYPVDRTYGIYSVPVISQQELDRGYFDNVKILVLHKYGASCTVNYVPWQCQAWVEYSLSKMDFFDLWIGMKLTQSTYGGNLLAPGGYHELDDLANDLSQMISNQGDYFQTNVDALNVSATLTGELVAATSLDFPTPKGLLDQLSDWLYNTFAKPVLSFISNAWDTLTTCGTFVNCAKAVWNNIVAPGLGMFIEDIKSIVTITANLIVDTVWNYAIKPLFPNSYSYTLSPGLQNILNEAQDQTVVSNWSDSMQTILSQYNNGLPSVQKVIDSPNSVLSSKQNSFGIFSVLTQLGGISEAEWAMNAILTRFTNHLSSWMNAAPIDSSQTDNFINQNNQLQNFQTQTEDMTKIDTNYQPNLGRLMTSDTISGNQAMFLNIQSTPGNDVKTIQQAASNAGTGISDLISSLQDKISSIQLGKWQIGLAITAALILEAGFAIMQIANFEFFTSSSLNILNNIISAITSAVDIVLNPLNTQSEINQELGYIGLIEGAKMGNDVFIIGKLLTNTFSPDSGWQFSLQLAQMLVFGFLNFRASAGIINLEEGKTGSSLVDDIMNFFNFPFHDQLNLITSAFTILGMFAATVNQFHLYKNPGQSNQISALAILSCSFLGLIAKTILFSINLYSKVISNNKKINSALIYLSSITSQFIKYYILIKVASSGKEAINPEIGAIATGVSWLSDFAQFFFLKDSLSL